VLLANNEKAALQTLLEKLTTDKLVHDILLYDQTGQLIASSSNAKDINSFYQPASNGSRMASDYAPFVSELRNPELIGYLRMTINQNLLTAPLQQANYDNYELMRLMALFAVVIGYFLTRGFSRFSRQGFRVNH